MEGIRDNERPRGGPGNGDDPLARTAADEDAAFAAANSCFAFLRAVPILFELDDATLWEIAQQAEPCDFEPGDRVVGQGEHEVDKRFYVIRSGSADVVRRDRAGLEQPIARLCVGSYFGELGLLTNQARNATVRVHGPSPLRAYAFDALTFHRLIAEHVLVFRVLRERQRMRSAGSAPGNARIRIKELDLLKRLPEPELEFVLQQAEHRWHPSGSAIVTEGDPGDRFYILLDGAVDIEREGEREPLAHLEPGEFFGETALLLDTPRTASVVAAEHSLTWSITRAAFQRLVGNYLLSNPRTQEKVLARMRGAKPAAPPTGDSAGE